MEENRKLDAVVWERVEDDWYTEPKLSVELLLNEERYRGRILDPACGHGTIGKVFASRNHPITSTDLRERPYGLGGMNFLELEPTTRNRVNHVVCNPPFSLVDEFAMKARTIALDTFAFLLPLKWIAPVSRLDLFEEIGRPARIHILCNRPSMPPGKYLDPLTGLFLIDDPFPKTKEDGSLKYRWLAGQKPRGGAIDYAWVVWQINYDGPTDTRWLIAPRSVARSTNRTTAKASAEASLQRRGV